MYRYRIIPIMLVSCILVLLLPGCDRQENDEGVTGFDAAFRLLSDGGFQCTEEHELYQDNILSVPYRAIRVDDDIIRVYEYASNQEMENDAAFISPDGFGYFNGERGIQVSWVVPPYWYKKGNVILLYVGEDIHIPELLTENYGNAFAGVTY